MRSARLSMRSEGTVLFGSFFVATFALGFAWLSVIGPFRGMDEFDHAYRADSVNNGYWTAEEDGVVVVDDDLVEAIRPVCLSRRNVDGACEPQGVSRDGVAVVSTAGAYNPIFYWVVGTASSAWDGYQRLYGMRLLLLAANSLLVATAALVAGRCFSTSWPLLGILVTLTPQASAAGMVVAANGLETSCALVLWVCLLAAAHGTSSRHARWLAGVAGAVGTPLAFMRTLGPLWLVLIVVAVLLSVALEHRTPREAMAAVRSRFATRGWGACAAVWTVASVAGTAWVLIAGTNSLPETDDATSAGSTSASGLDTSAASWLRPVVWIFQLVGALPYRDEPLPLGLYGIAISVWATLCVLARSQAASSFRWTAGAAASVALLVPIAFSIVTGQGSLWQGRYCWPLALGVFLVLGVGVDRAQTHVPRRVGAFVVVAVSVVSTALMVWALGHVRASEVATSPLAGTSAWWTLPTVALVFLPVLAFGTAGWVIFRRMGDDPAKMQDEDLPAGLS